MCIGLWLNDLIHSFIVLLHKRNSKAILINKNWDIVGDYLVKIKCAVIQLKQKNTTNFLDATLIFCLGDINKMKYIVQVLNLNSSLFLIKSPNNLTLTHNLALQVSPLRQRSYVCFKDSSWDIPRANRSSHQWRSL